MRLHDNKKKKRDVQFSGLDFFVPDFCLKRKVLNLCVDTVGVAKTVLNLHHFSGSGH